MSNSPVEIPAATFKAECLKLMDQVEKTREPIVITKHGRPVAQLAPVPASPQSLFGYMKDTVKIVGDVTAPLGLEWSALSGEEAPLYQGAAEQRSRRRKRGKK